MEAQIKGSQRKVFDASVRPVRPSDGDSGIVVREGRTAPFRVARSWSAPAGVYPEAWYLIDPETREVLYAHETPDVAVWGLQGLTPLVTDVVDGIPLAPAPRRIVFALGGVMGGELDVDVTDAS